MKLDPRQVLFSGERPAPLLSACDHYAGKEALVQKALQLQAKKPALFDVTIDLEDGAAAGQEATQAAMAVAMIHSAHNQKGRVGVRLHDPSHACFLQDAATVIGGAGAKLAYLTIPKVRSIGDVLLARDRLEQVRHQAGLARNIPLHVLIETARALADVFAIAAVPEVEVLDFGLMDFVSDHDGAIPAEAMRSPAQFEHALVLRAKVEIAAAAHAHKKIAAHNVSLDLNNAELTHADAWRARRELGFMRMWSVHPAQIDPILTAMSPDDAEIATATELLAQAQDADFGPITLHGALYDRGSYRHYWRVLERAVLAGKPVGPDAAARFFSTPTP